MTYTYVNLTPHTVRLNDGREFPPSGTVARVKGDYKDMHDDTCIVAHGDIEGLPTSDFSSHKAKELFNTIMTRYIVSAMVLQVAREEYMLGQRDWIQHLVAPATGHPKAVRDDKGQIVSVPCFVRA